MSCIKNRFLQEVTDEKWFPPINICDCPKREDSTEFDGLSKVTLEKNIQLRVNHCGRPEKYNLLTQDSFSTENTIYIVQYDFDLNGGIIRMPKNCTLVFYGGSIANGTLLLDETSIYPMLDLDKLVFCRVSGTYKKGQLKTDENGIYYWNGQEWKKSSTTSQEGNSDSISGKEYIGGVGISVKDNVINLNTAGNYNLGGIRTNYTEEGDNYAVRVDESGNAYVNVPQNQNETVFSFKSYAFKRSTVKPTGSNELPFGGSYDNPSPSRDSGWSDGIPSGTEPIWVSINTFRSDYTSSGWSNPELLADSSDMDVCFSSKEIQPDPPTNHGTQYNDDWHNDGREEDIWMAISVYSSGSWGEWQVVKIKGEQGPKGDSGSDGKSIKVVGNYKDTAEPYLQYIEGTSIFQNIDNSEMTVDVTEISAGDCLRIIGGNFDGHLMYCMDTNPQYVWMDLGKIEGAATYVHIKFSNDKINLTPVPEGSDPSVRPGDTPGEYIGFLTDNKIKASEIADDYKPWTLFKGNDGYGYWFIYAKLNPDTTQWNYYRNNFYYQDSTGTGNFIDSLGNHWYDEPQELQPGESQYVSFIREPLQNNKKWSYPKLWNSYPATYTLRVYNDNDAILDLNDLNGLNQNKIISWKLYLNGKEVSDYSSYYFIASVGGATFTITNGNTWNLNNVGRGTKKSVITVTAFKKPTTNTTALCSADLNIPIQGKDGQNKESSGFKIVLSNDLGVMPCNLDGTSVIGATTSTLIQAYYNETQLSNSDFGITLPSASGYTAYLESRPKGYNLIVSRLNGATSSVPFIVTYNGISYEKEFKIFKDLEGDSYELEVFPQVVTSELSDVSVKVFKTFDRATNQVVRTEIKDLRANNLVLLYYDDNGDEIEVNRIPDNHTFHVQGNNYISLTENTVTIDTQYITYINTGEASQGLSGCVLRFCGEWESGKSYVNQLNDTSVGASTIRWIDYVKEGTEYYLVAPLPNGKRITMNRPSQSSGTNGDWIVAEKMDFAYIQTLISDYISTTSLQAHQVLITRNNTVGNTTNIVAGIHQGNKNINPSENTILWSGSDIIKNATTDVENLNISEAPFQVKGDGTLIATKAQITGDIQANSFTTGETLEPGIVVITGSFENYEGFKNPNKIYFANDGNGNFNIYFYYDGQWLPMNLGTVLSPLSETSLTYYSIDILGNEVEINERSLSKSGGRWNMPIGRTNYQDWGNFKALVVVGHEQSSTNSLSEAEKFIVLDIKLFRNIYVDDGRLYQGNTWLILAKDKYGKIDQNGILQKESLSEENKYYVYTPGSTYNNVSTNIYQTTSNGSLNILFKVNSINIIPCIFGYEINQSSNFSHVVNNSIKTTGFA